MRRLTEPRGRGFTIVELLVVIGIITVLIAILLPALRKAREQARQIACASNEHQLAMAVLMYAGESRGALPLMEQPFPPNQPPWEGIDMLTPGQIDFARGLLWPYISRDVATRQRLFSCPSDDAEPRTFGGVNPGSTQYPRNFSYSYTLELGWSHSPNGGRPVFGVRLSQVRQQEHKILVLEQQSPGGVLGSVSSGEANVHNSFTFTPLLTDRHSRLSTVCFFDGHSEPIDPQLFARLSPLFSANPNMGYGAPWASQGYGHYVDLFANY